MIRVNVIPIVGGYACFLCDKFNINSFLCSRYVCFNIPSDLNYFDLFNRSIALKHFIFLDCLWQKHTASRRDGQMTSSVTKRGILILSLRIAVVHHMVLCPTSKLKLLFC